MRNNLEIYHFNRNNYFDRLGTWRDLDDKFKIYCVCEGKSYYYGIIYYFVVPDNDLSFVGYKFQDTLAYAQKSVKKYGK